MAVTTMLEDPLFVDEEIPLRPTPVHDYRISSITGRTFETREGSRETEGFRSHLLRYSSGKRIRQERYNRAGTIVYKWIYDDQGRPIREIAYQDSGEINYQIESAYEDHDQWIEKRMSLPDGRVNWRLVPQRNTEGILLECVYYNSQDQILRSDAYIYDKQGRLVTLDMGDFGEWTYQYDEAGNLTRKTGNLASASMLGETFEFRYDARSLLVERDHLNYEVTVFDYGFGD
jgi:YD repeat-containing protein